MYMSLVKKKPLITCIETLLFPGKGQEQIQTTFQITFEFFLAVILKWMKVIKSY